MFLKHLKNTLLLFAVMLVLTGLLYPMLITGIAQLAFKKQATGSIVTRNGQPIGSQLIGQNFTDPKYFWGRPSDTSVYPYNAAASGSLNYSMMNAALLAEVKDRIAQLKAADPSNPLPIPVDLVTASASGLDPDISVTAAVFQANRIARLRSLSLEQVLSLIRQNTASRMLGFLGEPVVNVLQLNLALDALK